MANPVQHHRPKPRLRILSSVKLRIGPIHGMTSSSNLGDPDRTITPDGSFRETMGARNPVSSTTLFLSARRVSLNMGVAGATPYHMPHNFLQHVYSHNSSPSPAPKSGSTFLDHLRRVGFPALFLTFEPRALIPHLNHATYLPTAAWLLILLHSMA